MRGGERAAEDDEAAATALRGGDGKFWQSLPCVKVVRALSGEWGEEAGRRAVMYQRPLVAGRITDRD